MWLNLCFSAIFLTYHLGTGTSGLAPYFWGGNTEEWAYVTTSQSHCLRGLGQGLQSIPSNQYLRIISGSPERLKLFPDNALGRRVRRWKAANVLSFTRKHPSYHRPHLSWLTYQTLAMAGRPSARVSTSWSPVSEQAMTFSKYRPGIIPSLNLPLDERVRDVAVLLP